MIQRIRKTDNSWKAVSIIEIKDGKMLETELKKKFPANLSKDVDKCFQG